MPLVPDVVHFQAHAVGDLALKTEVPPLVVPKLRIERQRTPTHASNRRAKRHAEKVISRRAVRHDVGDGVYGLAHAERQEVEVQPAARPFGFIEHAVAAANDRAVAEAPREPDAGPLVRVVLR